MVRITIDGQLAQVPAGTTIMEAAKAVNVKIPHLCYLKGINEISACRICCVEIEGERAMVAACSNPVNGWHGGVYEFPSCQNDTPHKCRTDFVSA